MSGNHTQILRFCKQFIILTGKIVARVRPRNISSLTDLGLEECWDLSARQPQKNHKDIVLKIMFLVFEYYMLWLFRRFSIDNFTPFNSQGQRSVLNRGANSQSSILLMC